jgi:cell division protein FtsN
MKSKICLFGLILSLLFSLESCKTKESAYKAAYETAQERNLQQQDYTPQELSPVVKTAPESTPVYSATATSNIQKEKVTVIDGAGMLQYSVVVGSFTNQTNAISLKERWTQDGYKAFLAQNERGMYRVIVATYSDKNSAISERTRIKERFYPAYNDAWILERY